MICDANDIDRSKIPRAHICIIGSGAAGLAMAHSLIGSGKTVTVLESSRHNDVGVPPDDDGHRYLDSDIQERLYAGAMPEPPPGASAEEFFVHSRIKAYGGTTNCWKGWTRPLDDEDFARYSLWPRGVKKALFDPEATDLRNQPYQRAMGYCSLPWGYRSAYHDPETWVSLARATGGKPLAVMPYTGRLRTEVVVKMGPYKGAGRIDRNWDFQLRWGPDIEKAQNVTIYRNANVRKLVRSTATGPLDSVMASTIKKGPVKGDDFTVQADRFVLAAGCVENVRLMLHSGFTAYALGRFLMTHPLDTQAASFFSDTMPEAVRDYYGGREIAVTDGPPTVMAMLTPQLGLMEQEKVGNFRIWLRFAMVPTSVEVDLNWEQRPTADNRVILNPDPKVTDVLFKDPLPLVQWKLGQEDMNTKAVALKHLEDVLITNGYAKAVTTIVHPPKLTGEHAMGATRMSEFADLGVVDGNCRVFTCPNLFLAGGSVLPTGGWANPTLTIIALALRLADHLKAQT